MAVPRPPPFFAVWFLFNSISGVRERVIRVSCYVCMWQTDCKLDQFVNGPPVYKPVIQFLNWLARFQLYKAK